MKLVTILCILMLLPATLFSQTNDEIASVYLSRAEVSYSENDMETSLELFYKAMKYVEEINDIRIPKLGMLLAYYKNDFVKAKIYAKQYFDLETKKDTPEYTSMLETYVNIEEDYEKEKQELAKEEARIKAEAEAKRLAQLTKLREQKRIDSLTKIWTTKSEALTIKVDEIHKFNSFGYTVYKLGDTYGILDENGKIIIEANIYKDYKSFDGFIVLINNLEKPTNILVFNSKNKETQELPNANSFHPNATNYGTVLLPRANGVLVMYPDDISSVFVYDLLAKKSILNMPKKELLKSLKKDDVISKYNKDLQVKIDGKWLALSSLVFKNMYPLFTENNQVYGYLDTEAKKILSQSEFNFIGPFYNDRAQVLNSSNSFWMDANGNKFSKSPEENNVYKGLSKIIKLNEGEFQIQSLIDGERIILKDGKTLKLLNNFINKK